MNALGLIRAGVGVACLIAPQFTCGLFRLPITAQTAFIARIVGSREIVLGDLTFTAKKDQKDRTDVRRLLQANFAADVMDVGALAYAFTTGMVSKTGLGLFGSGAVVFVGMAAAGLRSL